MKNSAKKFPINLQILIAAFAVFFFLAACAQKPALKQVSNDAEEKPINAPAQAEAIQQKFSK